jgi:hypothetical protein
MRPLIIDRSARKQVERVLNFALEPKHWYRPRGDAQVPGNDYRFVANLNSFRCVFTITEDNGMTARHLSISVPSEDYPNPFAAYTIAELFGFTGWDGKSVKLPESWMARVNKEEHCIVLAQAYEKAQVSA